jgi:hypothetical protein
MAKYRKKPVVIDALQLEWDTWSEMCTHAGVGKLSDGKPSGRFVGANGQALPDGSSSNEIGLLIPTLEGAVLAQQHDWVIRGITGDLYFVKDCIFSETYEKVSDAAF